LLLSFAGGISLVPAWRSFGNDCLSTKNTKTEQTKFQRSRPYIIDNLISGSEQEEQGVSNMAESFMLSDDHRQS
jgi:hypothetical protein